MASVTKEVSGRRAPGRRRSSGRALGAWLLSCGGSGPSPDNTRARDSVKAPADLTGSGPLPTIGRHPARHTRLARYDSRRPAHDAPRASARRVTWSRPGARATRGGRVVPPQGRGRRPASGATSAGDELGVTRWVAAMVGRGPEPVKSAGALTLSRRRVLSGLGPDPPHERSRMLRELSRWIDAVQERVGRFTSSSRWPWCLSSLRRGAALRVQSRLGLHAGAGVAPVRVKLSPGRGVHDALRRARARGHRVFAWEPPQARLANFIFASCSSFRRFSW